MIFKTSSDTLALRNFLPIIPNGFILDVGCGEGEILASYTEAKCCLSMDINKNLTRVWKLREKRPSHFFLAADMKNLPNILRKKIDLIVCNPPYFAINEGRIPPDPDRAAARHELKMNLDDLFQISAHILKKTGQLCIVHMAPRLMEILVYAQKYGFSLEELQPVSTRKSRQDQSCKLVLLRFSLKKKSNTIFRIPIELN